MSADYNGLTRNTWPGTWSPSSNHPIALDTELRGTLQYVSGNVGDRLTDITGQRLQEGMLVYVKTGYTAGGVTRNSERYYQFKLLGGQTRNSSTGAMPNAEANWTELTSAASISQLTDVNLTNLTDESVLVYETDVSQWIATTQIVTYQPSLRLENDWVETTIQGSMLQTGTYFIQLFANDTQTGVNGTNDNEYYSGIMSWYNGNTNSSVSMPTDEIALHRAGAGGEGGLFLRTYRSPTGDSRKLRLQIYSNTATASPVSYTFKFKRIM
jgi:hypothetical protein